MKIAIIGAAGFLGTKLRTILSKNHEVISADINESESEKIDKLDATKKDEVDKFLLKHKPDVVIDSVALTSSVACEKNPELAEKLNYLTAKNIAEACEKIGAIMIFMSSTYLFDGEKGNYNEEDKTTPINQYARTKIMAEKKILKISNPIIFRVDIMYGFNGRNVRNGVFDMVLSGETIELQGPNQMRQPLFVDDVAEVVLKLIEKNQRGIFHLAGQDRITMLDFLENLEKLVRRESKIKISEDEPEIQIKIPKNATLDMSKIRNLGIKTRSFKEGLEVMEKQLEIQEEQQ